MNDVFAASKMLKVILRCSVIDVTKVGFGGGSLLQCLSNLFFWGGLVLFPTNLNLRNPKALNPEEKSLLGELFLERYKIYFFFLWRRMK